jgi:uncharacterized protein YgiM (DUF1202 family)
VGHGSGALIVSSLSVGSHSLTVVYGGDVNYQTSTSNAVTQTVNKASTTTTLTSSANPSTYGANTTFTATVSPSGATGTMTFKDDGTTIGTAMIGQGSGSYATSALSVGSHSITALYGGDGDYTGSTSAAVTQWISELPPPPPSAGGHRGSEVVPRSSPISAPPSLNPATPLASPSPSLPSHSSSLQQRIAARRKAREQRIRTSFSSSSSPTESLRSVPVAPMAFPSQSPAPSSYRVTTPYLNFRADARVTSRRKDTLRGGDTITVLRFVQDGQWAEVQLPDGRTGYVSAAFIENVKQ